MVNTGTKAGGEPTAARVSRASTRLNAIREQLQHLSDTHSNQARKSIACKYRNLPDMYYKDDVDQVVTPDRFDEGYLQRTQTDTLFVHEPIPSGSDTLHYLEHNHIYGLECNGELPITGIQMSYLPMRAFRSLDIGTCIDLFRKQRDCESSSILILT